MHCSKFDQSQLEVQIEVQIEVQLEVKLELELKLEGKLDGTEFPMVLVLISLQIRHYCTI